MITHPFVLFLVLFGLHFALGLVAYIERRMKPLYALLHIKKLDSAGLRSLALHYQDLGLHVPDTLLIEPEPVLTAMLRKLEARVSLEISAVLLMALVPSSVLTALLV
jgi:hypothetical protein